MHRIDAQDDTQRWRFACPAEGHRHWRIVDGKIECRQCQELFDHLRDLENGELVPREDIEIVGPHADHKGRFGRPTVER